MAEEKLLIDRNTVRNRRRHYETIVIITPTLAEPQFKETVEKNVKTIEEVRGKILRQDDWGKKRMAYSIQKHAMGHYLYLRYIGTEEAVRAVERSLKLDANVLRLITVRLSDPLTENEERELIESAPREASSAPTVRGEEDEPSLEPAAGF